MHDLSDQPERQQIPPDLYSEYEERPFHHCTRCGESLSDFENGYQISKAFKAGECVFEYALCDHCRTALMEEFSEESKANLARFQQANVHLDRGLTGCAVCNAQREDGKMREFVLSGICERDSLLHGLMVCGACGEKTQELISQHTRDTWRRFVAENFPGPPADVLPEPIGMPAF